MVIPFGVPIAVQRSPSPTDADTLPARVPVTVAVAAGESCITASTRVPDEGPAGESPHAAVKSARTMAIVVVFVMPCVPFGPTERRKGVPVERGPARHVQGECPEPRLSPVACPLE